MIYKKNLLAMIIYMDTSNDCIVIIKYGKKKIDTVELSIYSKGCNARSSRIKLI